MPRKSATQKPAPSPAEATVEDATPNGVLIVKTTDEEGNIGTNTVPLGNVIATEVQTIIELGLKGWRQKLGFAE